MQLKKERKKKWIFKMPTSSCMKFWRLNVKGKWSKLQNIKIETGRRRMNDKRIKPKNEIVWTKERKRRKNDKWKAKDQKNFKKWMKISGSITGEKRRSDYQPAISDEAGSRKRSAFDLYRLSIAKATFVPSVSLFLWSTFISLSKVHFESDVDSSRAEQRTVGLW